MRMYFLQWWAYSCWNDAVLCSSRGKKRHVDERALICEAALLSRSTSISTSSIPPPQVSSLLKDDALWNFADCDAPKKVPWEVWTREVKASSLAVYCTSSIVTRRINGPKQTDRPASCTKKVTWPQKCELHIWKCQENILGGRNVVTQQVKKIFPSPICTPFPFSFILRNSLDLSSSRFPTHSQNSL